VEIVFRVGSTAMVVKRKTRNNGNTHCKPVVRRVQPLLKCAPSCRVRTPLDGHERAEAHHTERSLQLNGSHHDCVTQLVIHQQQPESHELLAPCTALAPVRPNPAEGLASHSCEAGLSQGHPHIARYHTPAAAALHLLLSSKVRVRVRAAGRPRHTSHPIASKKPP
jgi:hypothetical protein